MAGQIGFARLASIYTEIIIDMWELDLHVRSINMRCVLHVYREGLRVAHMHVYARDTCCAVQWLGWLEEALRLGASRLGSGSVGWKRPCDSEQTTAEKWIPNHMYASIECDSAEGN